MSDQLASCHSPTWFNLPISDLDRNPNPRLPRDQRHSKQETSTTTEVEVRILLFKGSPLQLQPIIECRTGRLDKIRRADDDIAERGKAQEEYKVRNISILNQ